MAYVRDDGAPGVRGQDPRLRPGSDDVPPNRPGLDGVGVLGVLPLACRPGGVMGLRRPASWVGEWPPVSRPPKGWTAERWEIQMNWSVLGIPPPGWKPPRSTESVRRIKRSDPDQDPIPGLESSRELDEGGRRDQLPEVRTPARTDHDRRPADATGRVDEPRPGVRGLDGVLPGDSGQPPPARLDHHGLPGWWRNLGRPVYCRACGEQLTVGAPAGKGSIAWRLIEPRPRGTWLCLSRDDNPHDPIELEGLR